MQMKQFLLILALSTLVVSCQKDNDSLKPDVETVSSKNRKRIESIIKNATSLTVYIRKFHDGSEIARVQIQDGKTDMFADSNFIKIKDSYYNLDMLVSFEYNPGYNSLDLYFG